MLVTSLLVSLLVLAVIRWYFRRLRLPPGPPAVPLLGCLPFLQMRRGLIDWARDPRVTNHRLATVSLGPRNLFLINDLKLAKALFEREDFSGRESTEWDKVLKLMNGKLRGIIHTEGEHWVKQRRFGLRTLRDLGFGRSSIAEIINGEVADVIASISGGREGEENYLVSSVFNIPVINVLWQLVAGRRFDEADSRDCDLITSINTLFKTYFLMISFPLGLTKLVRRNFFEENLRIVQNQKNYIQDQLDEHRATLDRENPRDFIDVYLIAMEEDEGLNVDDLAISLYDFLIAGSETSATFLKWLVLFLTINQEVQDKCRQEILRVLGSKSCTVEDIPSLPFTQATVAETHRLAAIAPLALAHQTTGRVEVEGFTFPPHSAFMSNLQFIMMDPSNFQDPGTFSPERFIGEDGRYQKHPALVPFGLGRRQCIGEALARNEVLLFTVGLIQRLTFLPPAGKPLPDPEDYHVGATRMPTDFYVQIVQNNIEM